MMSDNEEAVEIANEYLPYNNQNNYYDYSQLKLINSINKAYERSLTEQSERAEAPSEIKIPLKPHQTALLAGMEKLEAELRGGVEAADGTTFYSRYAILGDAVGAGKSLTVLGHIARMKNKALPSPAYYHKHSTPYLYSTWAGEQKHDLTGTLIIVPHSLYRQWSEYITTQTTLKIAFCKSRTFLNDEKVAAEKMAAADAVLVSNTIYDDLQTVANTYNIHWKRIFIDEVDNIQISRNKRQLHADFVWFISATWIPCISSQTTYISSSTLDYYISHGDINLDNVHDDFKANFIAPNIKQRSQYIIDSRWTSIAFFSSFLNRHPQRYLLVLRTTDNFRNMSLALPAINVDVVKCKGNGQHKLVDTLLSPQINEMIHAGDISGALMQLGVPESSPMSLIEAVTMSQQKELRRLESTLEFKKGLEYSTPALKEAALSALETKIASLKEQIASFEKRIHEIDKENCTICYEPYTNTTCVPCCKQLFCGSCILQSLKQRPACPMCRAQLKVGDLKVIKTSATIKKQILTTDATLLDKPAALLKLIQANPNGRFIVFSRHENPFDTIVETLEGSHAKVAHVKGNKDVIYSLIEKFREGTVNVLLLNSEHFATGMNLEAATHVVLYHGNMSPNERQQIIGRAHRLGRKGPLTVVQMLHENEAY
jgi:SNF2 family DNA or RNA helicase